MATTTIVIMELKMDDFGNTYWHYMSPAACIRWHVSQSCYGGAEDWDGYSVPVL